MSVLPPKFNAYILNNGTTRVADVYEAKPPTTVVIGQNKNLPSPGFLNQQWEIHVVHSGNQLKATFKAFQPEGSFAVAKDEAVKTDGSEMWWYLTADSHATNFATKSYRISKTHDSEFWTAQDSETQGILLQSKSSSENQLWTFVPIIHKGKPLPT